MNMKHTNYLIMVLVLIVAFLAPMNQVSAQTRRWETANGAKFDKKDYKFKNFRNAKRFEKKAFRILAKTGKAENLSPQQWKDSVFNPKLYADLTMLVIDQYQRGWKRYYNQMLYHGEFIKMKQKTWGKRLPQSHELFSLKFNELINAFEKEKKTIDIGKRFNASANNPKYSLSIDGIKFDHVNSFHSTQIIKLTDPVVMGLIDEYVNKVCNPAMVRTKKK